MLALVMLVAGRGDGVSWSMLRSAARINALWLLAACASGVAPTASPSPTAVLPLPTLAPLPSVGAIALAPPAIQFRGAREETTPDGRYHYVAYLLEVTNSSSYPPELFASMLGAVGCGDDNGVSRARVDVFDAALDMAIVTLCGLPDADAMDEILLRYPLTQTPPASVYLTIADRATGALATSAPVAIAP